VGSWAERVIEECGGIEAAVIGEGAFGPGPAVWVGRREVAHADDESTLDVRLTKAVIRERQDDLMADARVALRTNASDWMEVRGATTADAEWAVGLIRDAVAANVSTAPPGDPPTGPELERRRRFH
jgi:hypothetical protein